VYIFVEIHGVRHTKYVGGKDNRWNKKVAEARPYRETV